MGGGKQLILKLMYTLCASALCKSPIQAEMHSLDIVAVGPGEQWSDGQPSNTRHFSSETVNIFITNREKRPRDPNNTICNKQYIGRYCIWICSNNFYFSEK